MNLKKEGEERGVYNLSDPRACMLYIHVQSKCTWTHGDGIASQDKRHFMMKCHTQSSFILQK